MKLRVVYANKAELDKLIEKIRDYIRSIKISEKPTQKGKKIAYIVLKISRLFHELLQILQGHKQTFKMFFA